MTVILRDDGHATATLVGGEVETRRNLAEDPRATSSAIAATPGRLGWRLRWYGSGGTGSFGVVAAADGPLPEITTYQRATWTGAPANKAEVGFNHTASASTGPAVVSTNDYPVTPGETIEWSSYVRMWSATATLPMSINLMYRNASGAALANPNFRVSGVSKNAINGQWVRVSLAHTVPAGAAFVGVSTFSAGSTNVLKAGDRLDGTGLLVERASETEVGDYFDGSTPNTDDYLYSWAGVANASESIQTQIRFPLGSVGGVVSLDEGGAPHVVGTLSTPLPDDETLLEQLDPRTHRRVTVAVTAERIDGFGSTSARSFDLGLRSARIDEDDASVTLELESDEALLIDDVWLAETPNTDALAYQSSLRAIIDNVVLARIGAALEPGGPDAPFRVLWDATNVIPNPNFRTELGNWTVGGVNALSMTRMTGLIGSPVPDITTYSRSQWSGASGDGNGGAYSQSDNLVPLAPVSAQKQYTIGVWVRSNVAKTVDVNAQWVTSGGVTIGSNRGDPTALTPNVWTRVSATFTAPVDAARIGVFSYAAPGNQWAAGNTYDTLGWIVVEGTELPDVAFDGDSPDTTEYGYNWTGTPNASTSTRTALIDRAPDLLHWKPGVNAWAFVSPIIQSAGFRLFCDERRRWWLVDGAGYLAPGITQLSFGAHVTRASTGISRDGDWFDAALVRYRWRDSEGTPQERIDWYAAPGWSRARTFDIDAPYPGPGRAQYKVKRAEGLGRTATVEAPLDLTVTPSQALRMNFPNLPELFGVTRSVAFDLGTFRMTVESRGLTDVPAGAWILVDPALTWAAVDPALTWANATPENSTIFD